MILYVSNEYYGEGIPIPFPATAEEVRKKLDAGVQPLFIRGNGPVWHFEDRLDPAALYQETGDIYLVADVLGHSDVGTTRKHYAAIKDQNRRKAAQTIRLRENG